MVQIIDALKSIKTAFSDFFGMFFERPRCRYCNSTRLYYAGYYDEKRYCRDCGKRT